MRPKGDKGDERRDHERVNPSGNSDYCHIGGSRIRGVQTPQVIRGGWKEAQQSLVFNKVGTMTGPV